MKNSESGHAKNVANFKALITYCTNYGAAYNPGNDEINVSGLNILYADASNALNTVFNTKAAYDHITNEREIAFKPLAKLCTRIINALKACGTSDEKLKDARSLIKKISGVNKKKRKETPITENPEVEAPSHSTSQMSYDNQLANFKNLIELLLTETKYHPNEMELSVTGLTNLYQDLYTKTQVVTQSRANLNVARIERNKVLYLGDLNVYKIATNVRSYIKAIFGSQSEQYKKISGLRISNYRYSI
jgi:hypothetical protein